MNVLIVHAHPEAKSFNTALMTLAQEHFLEAGHTVVVSDLYAMNWNPVASAADFAQRKSPDYLVYALEQRHNYEQQAIAPDIAAELDKVKSSRFGDF
jgi:NAD(P)H dehydrogenase (quinone)